MTGTAHVSGGLVTLRIYGDGTLADTVAPQTFTAWSFTDLIVGGNDIYSNHTLGGKILDIHMYPVLHDDATVAANRLTLKNYLNGLGIN